MIPAELVGAWSLVSVRAKSTDGEERLPLGENPVGQLLYAASGHMALIVMSTGRTRFASGDALAGTPEEIREAFEGFEAYAGSFEVDVDDNSILHRAQICRFPNWEGGTQFRFFELSGDTLELSSPPMPSGGKEWVLSSVWQRKG